MKVPQMTEKNKSNFSDFGLTEYQVSEKLNISRALLRKHRRMKTGIPYVKIGYAVRYMASDVENYIKQQRVNPEKAA